MSSIVLPLALLQSDAGQTALGFVPLILIFAIFYFLVIAPGRKRQKALQATVSALKKGDKVITSGGLYGEVISTDTVAIVMKISDNVRVKVSKASISGLQGDPSAEGGS